MRGHAFIFLFLIFSNLSGFRPDSSVFKGRNDVSDAFDKELSRIAALPAFEHGTVSFSLRNPDGIQLVDFHAGQSLIPASTLKLLTTAASMEILGPEFRIPTSLNYTGHIDKGGVLWGDLVILAGADPSLGSTRFTSTHPDSVLNAWAHAVQKTGIKTIKGKLRIESEFPQQDIPDVWTWQDIGNYYAAPVSGLCFEENTFNVYLTSGNAPGSHCEIQKVDAPFDQMQWTCEVTAGAFGSGDQAYVYMAPGSALNDAAKLKGTIPPGKKLFRIKAAIPRPADYLLGRLEDKLLKYGIEMQSPPAKEKGPQADSLTTLAQTFSPSLMELSAATNKSSLNLYAEQLLLQLANAEGKNPGTATGLQILSDFILEFTGDESAFHLADGSGLSRENAICASLMSKMLSDFQRKNWWNSWYTGLPVSGISGTMRRVGSGKTLRGKIHAKSGSMRSVCAYAGYVESASSKLYAFSFVINHFDDRLSDPAKEFEKLMEIAINLE